MATRPITTEEHVHTQTQSYSKYSSRLENREHKTVTRITKMLCCGGVHMG